MGKQPKKKVVFCFDKKKKKRHKRKCRVWIKESRGSLLQMRGSGWFALAQPLARD